MKYPIHIVMAARPNMMKVAPLYHALKVEAWAEPCLVHTGQHYDDTMSGAILRDLNLPEPHYHLGVGGGSHAEQTGATMVAYENICRLSPPALTIVVGDVNATVACALTAKKLGIPLAHMEAGLRSFDRSMPEEINRLATDAISDFFWTPSQDATLQLVKEGHAASAIREVGNIMIDSYCQMETRIRADDTCKKLGFEDVPYLVATFHRPSNVDEPDQLSRLVQAIIDIASRHRIIFPVHPRTRSRLEQYELWERLKTQTAICLTEPLSYIPFMNMVTRAQLVLTDSGGVQEETSYLGIPCLTLRENTERPTTITHGTNRLTNMETVAQEVKKILHAPRQPRPVIAGWDGKAAMRTVAHIKHILPSL